MKRKGFVTGTAKNGSGFSAADSATSNAIDVS